MKTEKHEKFQNPGLTLKTVVSPELVTQVDSSAKIEEVKCNKCQVQKTVSLVEGTECCCPAEMTCVDRLCPAIKVASCRPCEMVVESVDECGCKSTICKPRSTPECPTCSKLLCSGTDKETGCPIFECEAYDTECPAGT